MLDENVDIASQWFKVELKAGPRDAAMATAAIDWEAVKQRVLTELRQHKALRPTELLANLANGYPDVVIKESVLRLLQEQTILMTPDQQLELNTKAA